jgi:hypothetical protein
MTLLWNLLTFRDDNFSASKLVTSSMASERLYSQVGRCAVYSHWVSGMQSGPVDCIYLAQNTLVNICSCNRETVRLVEPKGSLPCSQERFLRLAWRLSEDKKVCEDSRIFPFVFLHLRTLCVEVGGIADPSPWFVSHVNLCQSPLFFAIFHRILRAKSCSQVLSTGHSLYTCSFRGACKVLAFAQPE